MSTSESGRLEALLAGIKQLEARIVALESGASRKSPHSDSGNSARGGSTGSAHESKSSASRSNRDYSNKYLPTEPDAGPATEIEHKMRALAKENGLLSSVFHRAPMDYYAWRLEQRRVRLNAPSVHHLCKTIVMFNSHCTRDDFSDRTNSKYYMIIVQYTARLHNDRIRQAICALSDNPPPRKAFNFRLCPPEINDKLTGYTHNAVAPIGCTEKLPVIISDRIAKLDPPFIWLGGGEVDLKWRVSVDELFKFLDPIVANITYDEVNENPEPNH